MQSRQLRLFSVILASSVICSLAIAQSAPQDAKQNRSTSTSTSAASKPRASRRVPQAGLTPKAKEHYVAVWGVDSFEVKTAESGQMVRFTYRIVDAQKAAAVNDKKATPFLIDEAAHVKLVVPDMEKVGQLRQSSTPEAGKSYWMVFSNKGGFVKRGDRVSVQIGKFRVDGLIVE